MTLPVVRSFNFKPIRAMNKRFKAFNVVTKSMSNLDGLVRKNTKMQKVIKTVFSKKTAVVAGVGTALGLGISSIWNYIESNSGCFKKLRDGSVCKVKELSCCQKERLDNVPNCPGMGPFQNACHNYDADQEESCCLLCDCVDSHCDEGEEMKCQRPTVADALTHFADQVKSGVWSAVEAVFPWASYVVYAIVALLALWLLSLAWPVIRKMVPRNKDV